MFWCHQLRGQMQKVGKLWKAEVEHAKRSGHWMWVGLSTMSHAGNRADANYIPTCLYIAIFRNSVEKKRNYMASNIQHSKHSHSINKSMQEIQQFGYPMKGWQLHPL